MKLAVSRETFLARLSIAVRGVSTRSAIQTLAGVLIKIDGGRAELQATGALSDAAGDDRHLVTNVEIAVDGDSATALSTWVYLTRGPDGEPHLALVGHYEDVLRRTPAGWRFARRAAPCDIP